MTTNQGELYRIPDREATANHLYAGVDLGSNTFRLLIGKVKNGRCVPVLKKMHTVRIGEALHRTGRICDQAIRRAQDALTDFRSHLNQHQPEAVRICGTAALRVASNREQFLNQTTTILGRTAEVIDGQQEALLSGIGAFSAMQQHPTEPTLLADIGGGSSELMIAAATPSGPEIQTTISLPFGAVNLSETFLQAAYPLENELATMAAHIEATIGPALAAMAPSPQTLIGIGGTATALAALDCNLYEYDSHRIQDHRLALTDLEAIKERLSRLAGSERNHLPGLADGRGEIIIGGLMIFLALLKTLPCPALTVSDGGLLEGLVLSLAREGGQLLQPS